MGPQTTWWSKMQGEKTPPNQGCTEPVRGVALGQGWGIICHPQPLLCTQHSPNRTAGPTFLWARHWEPLYPGVPNTHYPESKVKPFKGKTGM